MDLFMNCYECHPGDDSSSVTHDYFDEQTGFIGVTEKEVSCAVKCHYGSRSTKIILVTNYDRGFNILLQKVWIKTSSESSCYLGILSQL